MAERVQDLAKRSPHPERDYFESFAKRSDGSDRISDQTKLAQIA